MAQAGSGQWLVVSV